MNKDIISYKIRIKKLIERNKLGRRFIQNENYFEKIDTENKAYFLGFLYADGWVTGRNGEHNRLAIHLKKDIDNEKLLTIFMKEIGIEVKIGQSKKTMKNKVYYGIEIVLTSDILTDDLIKHGCVPRKSLILRFPTTVPDELMNHFIRGYFDGDGCISIYKTESRFVKNNFYTCSTASFVGTELFLSILKQILENKIKDLGNVNIYKNKKIKTLGYGGRKNCIKLYNYLYSNATIFLQRKKDIFEKIEGINNVE